MRKLMMTLTAVAFLGVASVNAQDGTSTTKSQTVKESQPVNANTASKEGMKEISRDQLPAAVQEKLKSEAYAKSKVGKVYMTRDKTYMVEVEGKEGKQKLHFRNDGSVLK